MLYAYNSKYDALKDVLHFENIESHWSSQKVTFNDFLLVISKSTYSLSKDLKICAETVSKLLSNIAPDRVKSTRKVCNHFLQKYNLKHCPACGHVYELDCFHDHAGKFDSKNTYCILCFNDIVRDMRKEYQASKRSILLRRSVSWANREKIKEIYKKCPKGYHVDHIIPLQGDLVSGLHVESNLQYLTSEENVRKSNKYIPV